MQGEAEGRHARRDVQSRGLGVKLRAGQERQAVLGLERNKRLGDAAGTVVTSRGAAIGGVISGFVVRRIVVTAAAVGGLGFRNGEDREDRRVHHAAAELLRHGSDNDRECDDDGAG